MAIELHFCFSFGFFILRLLHGIGAYSDVEANLIQNLRANATPVGRPVMSNNEPVDVSFDLKLHKIEKLLTREQHLITHTFITMRWTDPRLKWDPATYNGTKLVNLPNAEVWTPDLVLYNTADINNNAPADFYKSPVHVYHNGSLVWFSTVAWQSSCAVDITWFPVDRQECEMIFGSLSHSKHRLRLSFHQLPSGFVDVQSKHHVTNGEWNILSISARTNEHHYDCCDAAVSQVIYTITLKRRPLYFFLYLIFPMIAIVLLSLLIFKIPADAGERIGFAVTILLTMGVYLMVISQDLPRKADNAPLVGILYVTLFYAMVLGCVTGVVTAGLAFKITTPPQWLCDVVLRLTKNSSKKIGALRASSKKKNPATEKQSADAELTMSEIGQENSGKGTVLPEQNGVRDPMHMPFMRQRTMHHGIPSLSPEITQTEADNQKKWQEITYFLDRMFFWIYLIVVLVSSGSVLLGLELKNVQS